MKLTSNKKPAFGMDIGDLSFKMAQLDNQGGKIKLASYVKYEIPKGLIQGGEVKKVKEIVKVLNQAFKKTKGEPFSGRQVVCNLPEEKVFTRIIQLPKMSQEELAKAIYWEAEAHIPLAIKDVYLSWQIIKPIFKKIDHLDILIAAVPRRLVDNYVYFLRQSGLEPVALEPESVALVRSLISRKDLIPTMIVDLGVSGSSFVIFSALAIRFTSRVQVSGQVFNQAIMDQLKVDETKANQLKIEVGLDKKKEKGKVYQALLPAVKDLAKQIKEYALFYQESATHVHGPDGAIGQVILCGGDALLINLPEFLSQELNLPVKLGNPFVNIPGRPAKISKRELAIYATALGLALRQAL